MAHTASAIMGAESSPRLNGKTPLRLSASVCLKIKDSEFPKGVVSPTEMGSVPVGAPRLTFSKDIRHNLVGREVHPSAFPDGLPYLQFETSMVGE